MAFSYFGQTRLTEKRSKQAAKLVKKFVQSKGLDLKHTEALDLIAVLAGVADWRSLQASLTALRAGKAERMSLDEFEDEFKPMKNHLDDNASYEGHAFETYGAEFEYVQEIASKHPGKVWTVVDGDDGSMWLISGLHHVNRIFYVITNVATLEDEQFEVAYGHEDTDKLYKVTIFDNNDETEIVFEETVYAESAKAARERLNIEIDDETSQILENGGQPYVIVEEAEND